MSDSSFQKTYIYNFHADFVTATDRRTMEKTRYLIAGSSFVKRLEQHCGERWVVKGREVDFVGLPGSSVRNVHHSLRNTQQGLYSVIVLSVGSNDLCNAKRTAVVVANDLIYLAHQLISAGTANIVIICQLLYRTSKSHFVGLDIPEYNKRIDECNDLLKQNSKGSIRFWKHHHSVLGSRRLSRDGVHLNANGLKAYSRSIMQAISIHDKY